jgi:hypothetical protein
MECEILILPDVHSSNPKHRRLLIQLPFFARFVPKYGRIDPIGDD